MWLYSARGGSDWQGKKRPVAAKTTAVVGHVEQGETNEKEEKDERKQDRPMVAMAVEVVVMMLLPMHLPQVVGMVTVRPHLNSHLGR